MLTEQIRLKQAALDPMAKMVNVRSVTALFFVIALQIELCFGLGNIALNRPAWEDTTDTGDQIGYRAVDGNASPNLYDWSCTHTTNKDDPWWMVDLGKSYLISHVKIVNRDDCCQERLTNFTVDVAMEMAYNTSFGKFRIFHYHPGDAPPGVLPDIYSGLLMPAKYVKVQVHGLGILTLCEVEVYGVEVFWPAGDKGLFYRRENTAAFPPVKETHQVSAKAKCALMCGQKEFCKAFGLKESSGGMFECQLTEVVAAVNSPGWSFYSPCQLPV